MREIDIDYANECLDTVTSVSIPDEYAEFRKSLGEAQRRLFPYMYNLFENILNYRNVKVFLENALIAAEKLNRRDVKTLAPHMEGAKRFIDVGCGWGGMTRQLCELSLSRHETGDREVFAVDYVLEHAVATKILNPEARVFQVDARSMSLLEDGYFDFVMAHGVIEHVGDHQIPVGASGANLKHQYAFLKELTRIARLGGKVFLSTGNYLFPRDGETDLWFYHWLPEEEKRRFNEENARSTDKYWLMTWEEMSYLLESVGLELDWVAAPEGENWEQRFLNSLDVSFKGLDQDMISRWTRLVREDPRYFSSWLLVGKKTSSKSSCLNARNNACYLSRCVDASCNANPEGGRGLQFELEMLRREKAELQARVDALTRSSSWRLTAPLRSASAFLLGKK
jgi:SAM-dependent methyltransferase